MFYSFKFSLFVDFLSYYCQYFINLLILFLHNFIVKCLRPRIVSEVLQIYLATDRLI